MVEAIIFDWKGTLHQQDSNELFPYSERVLRELQPSYKLAVISKAVSDSVEKRTEQIESIKQYFEYVSVEKEKTPEQYLECIKKLGVKPESTLVVDDRMDRGIQIGNKLGCKTAWIQKGKYSNIKPSEETGNPTYIINSIEDLLEIV